MTLYSLTKWKSMKWECYCNGVTLNSLAKWKSMKWECYCNGVTLYSVTKWKSMKWECECYSNDVTLQSVTVFPDRVWLWRCHLHSHSPTLQRNPELQVRMGRRSMVRKASLFFESVCLVVSTQVSCPKDVAPWDFCFVLSVCTSRQAKNYCTEK